MLKELGQLYAAFFRIGGFTFGGGYAMLPMIQKEVVESKKWATEEEVMDYYAIGQCTPGVIAINTATFIGYKVAGVLGALAATLGVVTPCWIIITIIALFIRNFAEYAAVQHALAGIRVAVFALVLDAVIKLGKKSIKNWGCALICGIVFLVSLCTDISAAWLVIIAGIGGILYSNIKTKFGSSIVDDSSKGGEK